MHTDPIADLLTRIRNASRASHEKVTVSYSKIKENILKVMQQYRFIESYKIEQGKSYKELVINLKEERRDINLLRISKPGQRIYIPKENVKKIKSGLGIAIISTSKGVMANIEANKAGIGGELICEIF